MSIFTYAASMDKQTCLKLITEAHLRNWLAIRDDLIERYKHTFTDNELEFILKMLNK